MYLARREIGKPARVYPLRETSEETAWAFDPRRPNGVKRVAAPLCNLGISATGKTFAQAVNNLANAEEMAGAEVERIAGEVL